MLPEVVALALAAQLLRRSPAGEVPAWGQLWHRPAALDLADFRHSMGCGERAGFSWVYQSGGSGIALLVFGLAAVALTAALHLGAAILYVPKVGPADHLLLRAAAVLLLPAEDFPQKVEQSTGCYSACL